MNLFVKFYGRSRVINVQKAEGFAKLRGLMFRSRDAKPMLFEFSGVSGAIHSFFVFFPFLAVWLDGKNNVVLCQTIKPFRPIVPAPKNAQKLVEVPLNSENAEIIEFFVGKIRKV